MRLRNSLVQQGVLVILFPLICQLIVVLLLSAEVSRLQDEQLKAAHARDVISMAHTLVLDSIDGVYAMHMDSDREGMIDMEASYKQAAKLRAEISQLQTLASRSEAEKRCTLSVDAAARGLFEVLKWIAEQQSQGDEHWRRVNQKCYSAVEGNARNFLEALQALEVAEEPAIRESTEHFKDGTGSLLLMTALAIFVLSVILGLTYVAKIVGALKLVDRNRLLLSERKPLLPEISAHDELKQLDLAVHSASASLDAAIAAGQKMIREAGNLICSLDNDLLFVEVNPAAAKIAGLAPGLLVGKSVSEFVDSACVEQLRGAQSSGLESKFEFVLRRADGTKIHTRWAVKPALAPAVLFCVIQDISEQKESEGLRQRFLDAVRSSLRAPIVWIADEIQSVIGSKNISEKEEKSRNDLKRAARSARQCILLIDVLLDAQSAETGSIKIERKKISISQVVEESVELVRNIAEKRGVSLELSLIAHEMLCDPFKLTQTVVNFLSNAIKFSPQGGKIFVVIEERGKWLEVSVTDEGPGILPEYREQIFKPFMQVPGEKAKEGTGLGLAICKQIVDAHGGEIGVRPTSRAGTGSCFWFSLPKDSE